MNISDVAEEMIIFNVIPCHQVQTTRSTHFHIQYDFFTMYFSMLDSEQYFSYFDVANKFYISSKHRLDNVLLISETFKPHLSNITETIRSKCVRKPTPFQQQIADVFDIPSAFEYTIPRRIFCAIVDHICLIYFNNMKKNLIESISNINDDGDLEDLHQDVITGVHLWSMTPFLLKILEKYRK